MWLLLLACCAYLSFSIGVRKERGRREREQEEYEELQYQRSVRSGNVVLNSVRIRR